MDLIAGNRYLFDTSVFIDHFRKRPTARNLYFQARFHSVSVGYSIITEAELWAGIRGYRTVEEHIAILKPFNRYFINVTIARRAGELRRLLETGGVVQKGEGPYIPDCLIAATAEFYGLTVCTRDTRHFDRFRRFSISVLEYA